MWSAHRGERVSQDLVFAASGLSPSFGRGVHTAELRAALVALGFDPGQTWFKVPRGDGPAMQAVLDDLVENLARGVPSIVCMRVGPQDRESEHFRLVTGYDHAADAIVFHDPAVADGRDLRISRAELAERWPLRYQAGADVLIRLDLRAEGKLTPPVVTAVPSPADLVQHVRALREGLPGDHDVRTHGPFVAIGNEPREKLDFYVEGTIAWACEKLEAQFFRERPKRILDVWLMRDAETYEATVKQRTGSAPTTPYGFYASEDDALFMNISTGGGTLVHELVHPYVEADFPDAPAWLNEGLGSLFEQSAERQGKIVGLTNWRLRGLQRALASATVPSFERLAAMPSGTFYGDGSGVHYATARYLMQYMQERGVLETFYRSFRATRRDDPTGYKAMLASLGVTDAAAFREAWVTFVRGLRFEPG